MADDLTGRITALAEDARSSALGDRRPPTRWTSLATGCDGPLRLAIAGKVKAGKSTLLNAISARSSPRPTPGSAPRSSPGTATRPPLRDGLPPRRRPPWRRPCVARRRRARGRPRRPAMRRRSTTSRSAGRPAGSRTSTLIDTPGIASISTDVSARTHRVLAADDGPGAGGRRGALPAAAHARQRPAVPGVLPRRRARPRNADELGRRPVPGRRDRLLPAGRDGGRRPGRPPLPGRLPAAPAVPRSWSPSTACSGMRRPPCARRSTPCSPPSRGHRGEMAGELLLTADRFAIGDSSLVPVDRTGAPARPARPVRRPAVRGADPRRRRHHVVRARRAS